MNRRIAIVCMVAVLCFLPCLGALAEEMGAPFRFNGAAWGMTKEEVRSLLDAEPTQEPVAQTGHSALVYRVEIGGFGCLVQYNFLPEGELFNIEIMAPDAEKAFYASLTDTFTARYGDPLTEADASMEAEDAVAVMMAFLMQTTSDEAFLGWQADGETVIVLSFDPTYKVCYTEIRRYTDYFRFSSES